MTHKCVVNAMVFMKEWGLVFVDVMGYEPTAEEARYDIHKMIAGSRVS